MSSSPISPICPTASPPFLQVPLMSFAGRIGRPKKWKTRAEQPAADPLATMSHGKSGAKYGDTLYWQCGEVKHYHPQLPGDSGWA